METNYYLGKDGLQRHIDESKARFAPINHTHEDIILEFNSSLQFPTIGKSNILYIDTTANKIYRWDSTDLKYYSQNDYENITVIDGCY